MTDTWGRLDDDSREAIRARVDQIGDDEVASRIPRTDGEVRFRLFGGLETAEADMALLGEEFAIGPPPPREVVLIAPEDFDYDVEVTDQDTEMAASIDENLEPLREYYATDPGVQDIDMAAAPDPTLPPVVDHRPSQSPVKSQGDRGTCVSHASLALLEAAAHIPDDLSEQYTHYRFCEVAGKPQGQEVGFRTTDAAGWLTRPENRACLEQDWPYMPDPGQVTAAIAAGSYGPPPAALADLRYGYRDCKLIADQGVEGESIKNTRFLESMLALGYDIVIGAWASWRDEENRDVIHPILDTQGRPVGQGGHAMLMVGYDRPNQYFIVKNSWAPGWGHAGYGYFHYDFARSCLKYGFTVSAVEPGPDGA
jgi:hypothetical protein